MGDSLFFVHDQKKLAQRIEEKQNIILEFLSHEVFSTSEILGQLLNLSRTAAYKTLKSMEKRDLIQMYSIEYELAQRGKQTIWGLTPQGALFATDFESAKVDFYEAGRIATSTMAHSIAIQRVKVNGIAKGWTNWVSSRRLRQLAAQDKAKWRQIPDAIAVSAEGKTVAFEIERTVKTPARYEVILGHYAKMLVDETVNDVFYIGPERIIKRLQRLFSMIDKIVINAKTYPVHDNVRKHIHFLSFEDWNQLKTVNENTGVTNVHN